MVKLPIKEPPIIRIILLYLFKAIFMVKSNRKSNRKFIKKTMSIYIVILPP